MKEEEEKEKTEVIQKLEVEATYIPVQTFHFTLSQVQLITYMMDKHGEDWGAMARDPRNHYQETPAKLRGMVRWSSPCLLLWTSCNSYSAISPT